MNIITSAFLAARPKTLTASLIPVWAGCMVVQKLTGNWNAALALLTLASCLCLQIACNFFNDAIDHAKHADTERRTGPVRMTASGALSHGTVMIIGLAFLLGACLLALPLIELRGWPIIAIGIPSLYFTYGYTGGPWPLAYKGLGEIFVILFFGLVAVLGTILVQIGTAPVVPGTLVESLAVYNALHHAAHVQPGPAPEPLPYVVDVDSRHPLRRLSDAPDPQNACGQTHEQGAGPRLPPSAAVPGHVHNSAHTLKNASFSQRSNIRVS